MGLTTLLRRIKRNSRKNKCIRQFVTTVIKLLWVFVTSVFIVMIMICVRNVKGQIVTLNLTYLQNYTVIIKIFRKESLIIREGHAKKIVKRRLTKLERNVALLEQQISDLLAKREEEQLENCKYVAEDEIIEPVEYIEEVEEPEIDPETQQILDALYQMGFQDSAENLTLIHRCNNDMEAILECLLN